MTQKGEKCKVWVEIVIHIGNFAWWGRVEYNIYQVGKSGKSVFRSDNDFLAKILCLSAPRTKANAFNGVKIQQIC